MRIFILIALTCLALRAVDITPTSESLTDIRAAVSAGTAVLVDVREEQECKNGFVKGALIAPMSVLNKNDAALFATLPKNKPLYVYCRSGGRALKMAALLSAAGYDARALPDGYPQLIKAGFEADK
jgi:rhodanese-related sulfurtransferase